MSIRVLVVDDSRFFRVRVAEILNADKRLEVVGVAENGLQALEMAAKLKPDVITMDVEMPVMDGITAVKRIMSEFPTPVLIFSSFTTEGAKITLDALDAGAVDFLPKRIDDLSKDQDEARRHLCSRVWQIGAQGRRNQGAKPVSPIPTAATTSSPVKSRESSAEMEKTALPFATEKKGAVADIKLQMKPGDLSKYGVLAIGSSTGGPVALQEVLSKLPESFPLPILLIQHMPSSFTHAFGLRLDKLCKIKVKEAEDGDVLMPGVALLAPGGKQMVVEGRGGNTVVRIQDPVAGQTYKPSVDITYTSLEKTYSGEVLAIVLTGMGADGREGAKLLKRGGSNVWAQNEATCVVFGMPGAIVESGLADQILPLKDIGTQLVAGI